MAEKTTVISSDLTEAEAFFKPYSDGEKDKTKLKLTARNAYYSIEFVDINTIQCGDGFVSIRSGDDYFELYDGEGYWYIDANPAFVTEKITAIEYEEDINPIDNLITDRTQADVDTLKELINKIKSGNFAATDVALFKLPHKGAYNFEDLNRVGEALTFIADLFTENGYAVSINVKTDWSMSDIPHISDINNYLAAVSKIRSVLNITEAVAAVPATVLNFEQANTVESIVKTVYDFLQNLIAEYRYSNTFYSGEDDYR